MLYSPEFVQQILDAMDEHNKLSQLLIEKLIYETHQEEREEIEHGAYYLIQDDDAVDVLSENWIFYIHGEHCEFVNQSTGQHIEVPLTNKQMLAVLDPYFFYQFLKTSPIFNHLAIAFEDNPFNKMCAFFDVMVLQGHMKNVTSVGYKKCRD